MKTSKNRKVYKIDFSAIIILKGKERVILPFEETEIRRFLMTCHMVLRYESRSTLPNYNASLKKKDLFYWNQTAQGLNLPY